MLQLPGQWRRRRRRRQRVVLGVGSSVCGPAQESLSADAHLASVRGLVQDYSLGVFGLRYSHSFPGTRKISIWERIHLAPSLHHSEAFATLLVEEVPWYQFKDPCCVTRGDGLAQLTIYGNAWGNGLYRVNRSNNTFSCQYLDIKAAPNWLKCVCLYFSCCFLCH